MIDPSIFTIEKLIADMLGDNEMHWRHDAEIIPEYMPPCPQPDTRPKCVVRYGKVFLRHSRGPWQGHSWDIYGDDYLRPSLALIALSQAPVPPFLLKTAPPNLGDDLAFHFKLRRPTP